MTINSILISRDNLKLIKKVYKYDSYKKFKTPKDNKEMIESIAKLLCEIYQEKCV